VKASLASCDAATNGASLLSPRYERACENGISGTRVFV